MWVPPYCWYWHIMWRSPFHWIVFFPPWLSWFRPPPTMRLNGLVLEMAGSIGHRSAPRTEWGSILLWRMGKVVTSAVLSQDVSCTKRIGLDEAILSSAGYSSWGFFFTHQNPGEHYTLVLCMGFPYEVTSEAPIWTSELDPISWPGGVSAINCPSPDDGVSYTLCEVDVLDSNPQEDKFLNLGSGGDPAI
jgi:hypothetical protein